MGQFSGQSDVDAVRQATDLVALIGESLALRPRGREHMALCPFHDDSRPSFAVVTHKGNAFYKCHACGAAGDCFNWMIEYHKMSFGEALRALAERAGITLHRAAASSTATAAETSRSSLRDANAFAASFFAATLKHANEGSAARQLLERRGVTNELVSQFQIGAAPPAWDGLAKAVAAKRLNPAPFIAAGLFKQRPDSSAYDTFRNRLILPICDELGRPIAFGGRQIDETDPAHNQPKYLNSPESPLFKKAATLYGLHLAKREIIRATQAVIVEGYMDVIACHQAGITNVIGTLGTALTREHARSLRMLCETIVLVFDGDEAGQRAADRAIEILFAEPLDVRICVLPDERDPDDLLRQPDGKSRWDHAIDSAQDALTFKVSRFRKSLADSASPAIHASRMEKFLAELAQLGFASMQGVRRAKYISMLAGLLGVREGDIEASLAKVPRAARGPRLSETGVSSRKAGSPASAPSTDDSLTSSLSPLAPQRVPPARRRAEHELLAVLIAQPSLRVQPLSSNDGAPASIAAAYHPHEFIDAALRQIAETVFPLLADDVDFTVQDLLGQAADAEHRNLLTTLYLDGVRQCGESAEAAASALRDAHDALQQLIRRDRHLRRVTSATIAATLDPLTAVAAIDIIQQRRTHGYNPAAIPRGVRSS